MMNYFTFGGERSSDFGIYISGENTFNSPERDVEYIQIAGKNGDLTISNNRFKNISVSYPAFILKNFKANSSRAKAWLLQQAGYRRLEDTYDPDYFRMGQFSGPIDFDMRFLNYSGEMELTFNCKPQRWRKDGENIVTLEGKAATGQYTGGTLYNFERFASLPYMKVYGSDEGGEILVRHFDENGDMDKSNSLTIKSITGYIEIDSETQNAYRGTLNANDTVSIAEFPQLPPGKNQILYNRDIEKIEIKPRWWTI